jgi:hypothetical protein
MEFGDPQRLQDQPECLASGLVQLHFTLPSCRFIC